MNSAQTIAAIIKSSHDWYNGTVADVTQEQADFLPGGVAHPIGELMTHIANSEDSIVNSMILGKPSVWDRGGWSKKLGVENMMLHTTQQARNFKVNIKTLAEYSKAVQSAVDAYAEKLTDHDLERLVDAGGPLGKMPVSALLTGIMVGNTFAHTGEISALKGLKGAKGYPF